MIHFMSLFFLQCRFFLLGSIYILFKFFRVLSKELLFFFDRLNNTSFIFRFLFIYYFFFFSFYLFIFISIINILLLLIYNKNYLKAIETTENIFFLFLIFIFLSKISLVTYVNLSLLPGLFKKWYLNNSMLLSNVLISFLRENVIPKYLKLSNVYMDDWIEVWEYENVLFNFYYLIWYFLYIFFIFFLFLKLTHLIINIFYSFLICFKIISYLFLFYPNLNLFFFLVRSFLGIF